MQVRELVTRLGFDADTDKAQRYGKAVNDVKRVATMAATAVAGLSTATTGLIAHFTSASSETLAWSNRLGIASDELQRLQFAASKYQVNNRALIDGLKELSLRTDEFAKEGAGQAVESFERLGLSAEQLNAASGDTAELFRLVQSRISEIDNAAARQRIADELFGGQAGEQFSEFLAASGDEIERLGRLADETGAVVPEDVLRRAREFSRETGTLQATVGGFGKVLAAELLPGYRDLVQLTQQWLQGNTDLIRQGIRLWVDRLSAGVQSIASVVGNFISGIDSLIESTIGWDRAIRLVLAAIAGLVAVKFASWLWAIVGGLTAAVSATGALRLALRALQRVGIIALLTGIGLAIEDVIVWIQGGDSAIGKWIGTWGKFKSQVGNVTSAVLDYIEPLRRAFRSLGDVIAGAFTLDAGRVMGGLQNLGRAMVDWARQVGGDVRDALISMLPDWLVSGLRTAGGAISSGAEAVGGAASIAAGAAGDIAGGVGSLFTGGAAVGGFQGGGSKRVDVQARTEATLQVPQGTPEDQRRWIEQQAVQIFDDHWNRQISRALWDFQPVEG